MIKYVDWNIVEIWKIHTHTKSTKKIKFAEKREEYGCSKWFKDHTAEVSGFGNQGISFTKLCMLTYNLLQLRAWGYKCISVIVKLTTGQPDLPPQPLPKSPPLTLHPSPIARSPYLLDFFTALNTEILYEIVCFFTSLLPFFPLEDKLQESRDYVRLVLCSFLSR